MNRWHRSILAFLLSAVLVAGCIPFAAAQQSEGFTGDDFTDPAFTREAWTRLGGLDAQVLEENGDPYWQVPTWSTYAVSKACWPEGNKPVSVSLIYRFARTRSDFRLWFAYDEAKGYGAGLSMTLDNTDYLMVRSIGEATNGDHPGEVKVDIGGNDGKIVSCQNINPGEKPFIGDYAYDAWTRVDATYDYSRWDSDKTVAITYSMTVVPWNMESNVYGEAVSIPAKTFAYRCLWFPLHHAHQGAYLHLPFRCVGVIDTGLPGRGPGASVSQRSGC